jgi:hypothetical protein
VKNIIGEARLNRMYFPQTLRVNKNFGYVFFTDFSNYGFSRVHFAVISLPQQKKACIAAKFLVPF